MPLIAQVGRKKLKARLFLGMIYAILVIGALTMVYPFALMLSNSLKSYADFNQFNLIPRYFFEGQMLFKKYIVDKLKTELLGYEYGRSWYSPADIKLRCKVIDYEKSEINMAASEREGRTVYTKKIYKTIDPLGPYYNKKTEELNAIIRDWKEFFAQCPDLYKFAAFCHGGRYDYSVLDIKPQYFQWLKKKYKTVKALNETYVDNAGKFDEVSLPYEDPLRQRWLLPLDLKYQDWQEFKRQMPMSKIWVVSAELAFQKYLREKYPQAKDLAKATGLPLKRHSQLTLARAAVGKVLPADAYEEFIRKKCPVIFLCLDKSLRTEFRRFIKEKYRNFSREIQGEKSKIEFTELCPMDKTYSGRANEWIEFMEKRAPLDKIGFHDPMFMRQDFLRRKYLTVKNMNKAYGLNFKDFTDVTLPGPWMDIYAFREHKNEIFFKYLTGNYVMVFNVIALHGRALINTVIYVMLAILCALTINPLAAYALSRYKLKCTNAVLLFLLATMAFPPSVGMIPSFLLLKDLRLLNTFAALIVPVLANGYGIFLMKGFFDSLPSELYEAAIIDGASELTVFFKMALPLTKPILAIMALNAFTMAYSAFMFAFLTCQDPQMWTLMVFLYEFQQMYPNYLVMASLVVAAIPTLLVFIFCQNIILRGIVIPTFK